MEYVLAVWMTVNAVLSVAILLVTIRSVRRNNDSR